MKETKKSDLKSSEKKWGKKTMEAGFIVIPSVLIQRQKEIGLDSVDLNILLHLVSYWWDEEKPPFPSKRIMAEAIGVDPSTIRKRIQQMEKAEFIKRVERYSQHSQMSNSYDLAGLVKAVTKVALKELEEREKRQAARPKRASRKPIPFNLKRKKAEEEE